LITRSINPDDRRLYSIELTPTGSKLIPQLAKIADENDAHFFGHLSQKQFEELMHFFQDMAKRFRFNKLPVD